MPAVKSSQTVSDALHTATMLLSRSSPSARLDAELLLSYVTGLSRTDFRTHPERELPAAAGWSFQQLIKRRSQGEPVAYICQQQEFWSLLLEVGPAVLIPRPETELVVERVLAHVNQDDTVRIADLGTGSGAIALAVASERPRASVIAIDASRDALEIASRNIARLQVPNISLLHGSWLAPLAGQRCDVIASNPPYIAQDDPDLAPDVRRFEPRIALISGPTGYEALDLIIREAPAHLNPGGWLVLEHGWKQGEEVRRRLVRHGFVHVRSHADLAGHERVTEGQLGT
jgi:release factor glutamine methyltransferase